MKMKRPTRTTVVGTLATILAAFGLATSGSAAAPALNGEITPRPLTPQEKKDYALPNAQLAGGVNTIGVGQPVYLDAMINASIPASNIVSVTFTLTGKPMSSGASLTSSPLGANVPPYKMADRLSLQVAGRTMLVPDVTGKYTVKGTIVTDNGSGTVSITNVITASTYMGVATCEACHSGGNLAPNIYNSWNQTLHAHAFEQAIDGISTDHFNKNCISCHVLGYDTSVLANNGGFDDIATSTGWQFPTNAVGDNYAAMPASLRNVSNIQCENCHGAGSEHAIMELFTPNSPAAKAAISVSMGAGDCSQCHDSLTHHYKSAEWNNSLHAIATSTPSGPSRADCVRCHTAAGFAGFIDGASTTNTVYEAITCQACHDPHDASNPHQLRSTSTVTLMDGTQITKGGNGLLCMNCHMARTDATNYVETTAGNSRFGPHHGPQSDMLAGVNAYNYGKNIPSSAHRDVLEDSCVTCHMQEVTSGPAFTHAGGHTFNMAYNDGMNTYEMTEACKECHGEIESFDLVRQDYDGDGIVSGVQSEVRGLLNKLGMLLPPVGATNVSISSSYTKQQLRAAFNYQFVLEDGSFGVHNLSYAVGLLKASIADLTGDANNDGLADSWQEQYFGANWRSNPNAAPNATPAGDGIPNWLKYSLGLNPTLAGIAVPDGVVYADGTTIGGGTNTIHIFTAAEVAFDTQVGKSYQLQAISSLGGGWVNVSTNIPGTGGSVSYVTPMRNNVQQFFRVVSTP